VFFLLTAVTSVSEYLIQNRIAMNVNSNNNTRHREKWHQGHKQTSETGAEIEDECGGMVGETVRAQ